MANAQLFWRNSFRYDEPPPPLKIRPMPIAHIHQRPQPILQIINDMQPIQTYEQDDPPSVICFQVPREPKPIFNPLYFPQPAYNNPYPYLTNNFWYNMMFPYIYKDKETETDADELKPAKKNPTKKHENKDKTEAVVKSETGETSNENKPTESKGDAKVSVGNKTKPVEGEAKATKKPDVTIESTTSKNNSSDASQ